MKRYLRLCFQAVCHKLVPKAILMCVIAELGQKTNSELSITISQLTSLAIFFACRSCKYLKVPAADQQRTTILRICNIRFFRNSDLIDHDDDELEFSNCISLTFEKQKKDGFLVLFCGVCVFEALIESL